MTFEGYATARGGFSTLKMNHPGISTGLLTDATAICDKFSKQVEEYSKENTAVLESLKTEAETRAQAVVSVCVSERAKDDGENKEGAPPPPQEVQHYL